MKIILVSGARPNYMKIAPIVWAIRKMGSAGTAGIRFVLVHTGQHYDRLLFKVFFEELDLPEPDYDLGVGSGSHTFQTAEVMKRFEPVLEKEKPDLVMVVGDVNSTLACALTAAKMGIAVAHVEAGLRSFDRTMPEEINRVVTDSISDYLFTTEPSANENLLHEGVIPSKIFFVGNVMIDSLLRYRGMAKTIPALQDLRLKSKGYAVVTLHRPSNVDQPEILKKIMEALQQLSKEVPVVFPCHPRTAARIRALNGSLLSMNGMNVCEPMGYTEFLCLMDHAALVLTDSGGIQEETTILGVPCLTLRQNTERPITLKMGTNTLVGLDPDRIVAEGIRALHHHAKNTAKPPLWDGKASERIVECLVNHLGN
jgi:UDP-N-acetylglucosamine 2-epimerase (non-hydrolysing)